MGEVVPARTSPTLHPLFPPTVHQLSRLALRVKILSCSVQERNRCAFNMPICCMKINRFTFKISSHCSVYTPSLNEHTHYQHCTPNIILLPASVGLLIQLPAQTATPPLTRLTRTPSVETGAASSSSSSPVCPMLLVWATCGDFPISATGTVEVRVTLICFYPVSHSFNHWD